MENTNEYDGRGVDEEIQLAPEETEAVILKGRRKKGGIVFVVGGHKIIPEKGISYLGIVWDQRGTFEAHVEVVFQLKQKLE